MDKEKIIEQYRIVIVKIIDYLGEQQKKNNINENIPNIDKDTYFPSIFDSEPNDAFNKQIKIWQQYFNFQSLISKEFLEEFQ